MYERLEGAYRVLWNKYWVDELYDALFVNRTSGSDTVDADAGLLIDPEYVGMHSLKAESATELEDQGGGRRGFVDVIAALACYSPVAHGFFN